MPGAVELARGRVTINADDANYQRGVRDVIAGQNRIASGFRSMAGEARRANATQAQYGATIDQFTQSLRSSIIATAAYAAGVNGLRLILGGASQASRDWERSLVAVQKTADLTDDETARLGVELNRLITVTSSLGRPLSVSRDALGDIAETAGQMAITGVPNIRDFTEAVALMTTTTDLGGRAAANALGLLLNNTRATADESINLASTITALGNAVRGGESELIEQAANLARRTADFRLEAAELLGLAAAVTGPGLRPEETSSAIARTFRTLTDAASQARRGDIGQLQAIAEAAQVSFEDLSSTIESGNIVDAFQILLRGLRSLPNVAGQLELSRSNLITLLFGGETPPVRVAGVLNTLAENLEDVARFQELANDEYGRATAILEEAGRAAATYDARLEVVNRQLEAQGIQLGNLINSVYVPLAENFRSIEVAAGGAVGALLVGLVRSRSRIAQSVSEGAFQDASREVDVFTERQTRATNAVRANSEAIRAQQTLIGRLRGQLRRAQGGGAFQVFAGAGIGRTGDPSAITRQLEEAQGRLNRLNERRTAIIATEARAVGRTTEAVQAQTVAQRNLNARVRIGNRLRAIGSGIIGAFGGLTGVLVGTLAAAAVSWLVFSRRTDEAADSVQNAEDRLRGLIDRLQETRSGLTQEGRDLSAAQTELDALRERRAALIEERDRLQELINRAETAPRRLGGIQRSSLEVDLGRVNDEIRVTDDGLLRLSELLVEASQGLDRMGEQDSEVRRVVREFERLTRVIAEPTRAVDDLANQITRQNDELIAAAQLQQRLAGLSSVRQRTETLIAEQQRTITRQRQNGAVTLLRAQEDYNRAVTNRDTLQSLRAQTAAGTDARMEADKALATAQEQVASKQQELVDQRAINDALERTVVNRERAALAAAAEARAAQATFLAGLDEPRIFDTTAERESVDEFFADVRRRIAEANRDADQRIQLIGLDPAARSAEEARFQTINELTDRRTRAIETLNTAQARAAGSQERLEAATIDYLNASQDSLDTARRRAELARDAANADEEAVVRAQAVVDALEAATPLWEAYGTAAAEAARRQAEALEESNRPLVRLLTSIPETFDALEQTGVGAIDSITNAFGTQIAAMVDSQRAAQRWRDVFTSVASNIVGDLTRILVRMVVVRNLLTAFGIGRSGAENDGSISLQLGSSIGHAGGIVGRLPRAPRRALRADEELAVLKRGEEVLTANDPRHRHNLGVSPATLRAFIDRIPRYHAGGIVGARRPQGSGGDVVVNIQNNSGTPLRDQSTDVRFDGRDYVVDVVLTDIQQNGPIARSMTQLSRRR